MKYYVYIQLFFAIICFAGLEAQSTPWTKFEDMCKVVERTNAQHIDYFIAEKPSQNTEATNNFELVSKEFTQDGTYLPGLPKISVATKVIKNRVLPSPSKNEDKNYKQHFEYLKKLYTLSCEWNHSQSNKELATKIINSLQWYLSNYAPERPYWRLTFRFGQFEGGHLNYPILPMLDRVVLNMLPYNQSNWATENQKQLFYSLVDYTDHLVDQAVGAQNRGVNWAHRYNQIFFHFVLKYRLFGNSALYQLREHFYDGFEYDPTGHISGGMGTLTDGGFWHHGRAPYCLPYGKGDYEQAVAYMKFVENTPLEFEKLHYKTYEEQLLKKWQYVIYNDQWFDLGIVGGKNACQTTKTKAKVDPGTLLEFTNQILELKKENLNHYEKIVNLKNALTSNTHQSALNVNVNYWQWEYMLHRRPGWYIGYKGLSEETITSEWDQNFHLSSGLASILQRGNEYWNVRNALRWTALPGITAEQLPYQWLLQQNSAGTSAYCNGSSDGNYGLFAFNMGHENPNVGTVTASKAAFFFDKGIVNLTCNIKRVHSGAQKQIWTSLDNRELKGDIEAMINGKRLHLDTGKLPIDRVFKIEKTSWVWHDGIGYIVPVINGKPVELKLIVEQRTGIVSDVLPHNKDKKFSHSTFLLAINHGTNPNDEKANYIAMPGTTVAAMETAVNTYQIIQNDENIQAVFDPDTAVLEFAFRNQGKLVVPNFIALEAYGPIVGTLRIQNNKAIVSLANPYKSKLSNDVGLKGNPALQIAVNKKLEGKAVSFDPKTGKYLITLQVNNTIGYEGEPAIAEFAL